LTGRFACAISGDTLPQRKPHPAPMMLASRMLNVAPRNIVYVGDAARDVEAGRAAGMTTIAAAYGYITADDDPRDWNADAIALDTADLAAQLLQAVNLDA
jgi:phosphoglycolate phosphatase